MRGSIRISRFRTIWIGDFFIHKLDIIYISMHLVDIQ